MKNTVINARIESELKTMLIIYIESAEDEVILMRIGTHSQAFPIQNWERKKLYQIILNRFSETLSS